MNTAISIAHQAPLTQSIAGLIAKLAHLRARRFFIVQLIALTLAGGDSAIAGSTGSVAPNDSPDSTDYTIAVEAIDYMPLYSANGQNTYRGYARDLLDLFGQKFHYRFRYVALPVNRLYKEFFISKNLDFKFPDNPNWQPENKAGLKVFYSAPAVTLVEGLFIPESRARQNADDLNNIRTIGTITGFTPTPYLPAIASGKIKLYSVDSFHSLFTMSTIDRVDAIYTNNLAVQYYQAASGDKMHRLQMDRSLPSIASNFSLATLKHPEVVAQFNQFLQDDQVEIQKLRRKYGITPLIE